MTYRWTFWASFSSSSLQSFLQEELDNLNTTEHDPNSVLDGHNDMNIKLKHLDLDEVSEISRNFIFHILRISSLEMSSLFDFRYLQAFDLKPSHKIPSSCLVNFKSTPGRIHQKS